MLQVAGDALVQLLHPKRPAAQTAEQLLVGKLLEQCGGPTIELLPLCRWHRHCLKQSTQTRLIATAVEQKGFQLLAVAGQGVTMQAVRVLLKGLAYLRQVFFVHRPSQCPDTWAVLGAPVGT